MNIKEEVLTVLKKVKPTKDLENCRDIAEGGYIDSFELMMLISELNDAFGIEIGVEDIAFENFNSVEAMTAMVERLKG
ncbi:MAG: acyl carrier protein [Lachnospiraceae bacterium]|nr:acyl carrier protein [Lachnospiraceae bacterium]